MSIRRNNQTTASRGSESENEKTFDSERGEVTHTEGGFVAAGSSSIVQLDKAAEKRLLWKIDLMVIPTVALIYLFCFIDRANIGNARLAGLEKDLNMTGTYDYNQLLSIFYISYILFEIPSNIACKWMGPGWFLPILALGFGCASIGTAFVKDMPQACGVRFVLGVFESGMMPGTSYYLSRWYKRSELAFRLSLYVVMVPLAGAFGGFLASAILKLPKFGSLTEWRMIFAIEGIVTVVIALVAFVTLTDRPETARWLTKEEKDFAIARVRAERVGQSELIDNWKTDKRQIFIILSAPLVMTGFLMFLASSDGKVRYAATFLIASSTFAMGPLTNAQASAQVISDTSRSMSLATNMMFGNVGGLISTWSYIKWDAPDYKIGNGLNLGAASGILICGILTQVWMTWDNKRREKRDVERELEGLSPGEIENLEWKHPAWRWAP
ncbi:unnamed protein product [Parascedosporium putredinis]|uniref:Major facilitator superfamily (MFS) profile domain-containing protein n=1 Tax=Parascedosporium putredinis TaxID=1442378 RepID=A0A9P1MBU5_9PEZI|nr:unnamed protein product [Parascedosporium putredinis]CAI8000268.1 unnamed protein product [Parascedosporium putredinis]